MNGLKIVTMLCSLVLVIVTGCIGTDFLEEAADLVDPRIEIDPEISAVEIGQVVSFNAVYYDSTDMPASASFTWSTSDLSIAEVNEAGEVTGRAPGQVRVTASAFGISSEQALLSVVGDPGQVAFVEVVPGDTSIIERKVIQFSATAQNASRETLSDREITWRLSNDSLATIDENGFVRTLRPGNVDIIAASEGIESVPVLLEIFAESRTGSFRAAPNTSYTVEGTATLEQVSGGDLQLRFSSNFLSSNGPDLNVYLSPEDAVTSSSIQLGQLMSTRGEQVYEVPGHVQMNDFDYVIIHCVPFNVTFGFAQFR